MAKASKGAASIKTRRDFAYFPDEAVTLVKACATAKFDEVRHHFGTRASLARHAGCAADGGRCHPDGR